jgi:hypothetical protein
VVAPGPASTSAVDARAGQVSARTNRTTTKLHSRSRMTAVSQQPAKFARTSYGSGCGSPYIEAER